ncbi:MAG: flagellar hook-basal body complex protein FliE [Deltaproteobacteria bacterium]|jgi:flagellar hook-basal body complex protein FliE|nr:flagellar hook-basal body complex protein FliE [Deltaproteobacteria bacterium]
MAIESIMSQSGQAAEAMRGGRMTRPEVGGPTGSSGAGGAGAIEGKGGLGQSFEAALSSAVGELQGTQAVADAKSMALMRGEDIAVHDVMASVTEAEIAVQLTTAVAAKAIQAYQEIWRMEI